MIRLLRLFQAHTNLEAALLKAELREHSIRNDLEKERDLFERTLAVVKEGYKEQIETLKEQCKVYEAERRRRDDSFLIMCGARPIYEEVPESKPEPAPALSNEGRIIEEHQANEQDWWTQQQDAMRVAAARARQVQQHAADNGGEQIEG